MIKFNEGVTLSEENDRFLKTLTKKSRVKERRELRTEQISTFLAWGIGCYFWFSFVSELYINRQIELILAAVGVSGVVVYKQFAKSEVED